MLKMIKNRILILRDLQDEETESGILLPKEELPQATGIVTAIGPDIKEVKVGQKVLFKKLDGHDFRWQGSDYVILRDFNIQGVVTDGN